MASIPDPKGQFKEYQQSLFKALVSATQASNALPVDDIGFFRSLDRQFAKDLDTCGSRLLKASNQLLHHCSADTGVEANSYDDIDDVRDRYGGVVDIVDSLLEKADVCMDEMLGRSGHRQDDQLKQLPTEVAQVSKGKLEYKLLHASHIARPQIKFKDRIDNSPNTPFIRKIRVKPHAKVPLDQPASSETDEVQSLPHPYEYEIQHVEYPDFMFEVKDPIMYEPFDTTSATWVDTEEGLNEMMYALAYAKEIAIDLEHHNYRSFQGFTCLMQISTRDQDWILDTLELRDKLWMLNEYFADPNIVKVLHGAESDIIWLQRDFGLYIVNMFDTYFASVLLEFPQRSLAFLLKKYCNYDADKKYQLADWRIRPLPEEMLKYARSDTHFLLYIYDSVRNELLQRSAANDNLMRAALQRSSEVAAQKHEKEVYDAQNGRGPNGWYNLLAKWRHPMNHQQLAVFKALHQWRDVSAREQDESTRYILPNHMLFALVERMPSDSAGVIGCCNPCPPLVRMNAQSIGLLIQRTRMDAALQQPRQEQLAPAPVAESKKIPVVHHKVKVSRMEIDPAMFDLEKVRESRTNQASQISKSVSSLFGDALDGLDKDAASSALAEQIRSTLKLTLPFEGLKLKKPQVKEEPQSPPQLSLPPSPPPPPQQQQQQQEHVFVAAEQRETKKRKEPEPVQQQDNTITLRDTARKPKKKKNKKKKTSTPPVQ